MDSTLRTRLSPEVIHELEEFPHRDEISRPSSCRGVLVDGGFFVILFLVHTISIDAQIYFYLSLRNVSAFFKQFFRR